MSLTLLEESSHSIQTYMRQETLLCTTHVTDLYTMVPQIERVLSLKKMDRYLLTQVDRCNKFTQNTHLSANISLIADFMHLHMENQDGYLFTKVYHKPSYEPYYLPFDSIQPLHMFTFQNYNLLREKRINSPVKEKISVAHRNIMFIHFTYFSDMRTFPANFHTL